MTNCLSLEMANNSFVGVYMLNEEIIMATINAKTNKKEYITIKSGSGDDTITLQDGNFKVYAGRGNDTITMSNGDNYVYAQYGDNTISLGSGNDVVYAGKGRDEFVFNSDFGNDVIYNAASSDSITFGSNFNTTVFSYIRKGNDLIITDNIDTQSNKLTLSKYFKSKSKLDYFIQNDTVKHISDQIILYTGKGKIRGTNYNDGIVGSVKKDTIYGYAGNDMFLGGLSNDKIYSGKGENTILINNGDGHDTLYVDKDAVSNTIRFDLGDKIYYSKSNKDLVISAENTSNSEDVQAITIKNYFSKTGSDAIKSELNIGSVGRSDSESLQTALADNGVSITGSLNKSNTLYGAQDYDNTIYGGNKSDKIYAGNEDNRIDGGKGNDRYYVNSENKSALTKIFDESGNDQYNIKSLDTSVFIKDSTGNKDVLKITDDVEYTLFFDVSVSDKVAQYDSLFLVANKNYKDKPYTEYTAGGVEIANFFEDNGFAAGKIEKISVGGKDVDISLDYFDKIRGDVSAWLNLGDNDFSTAMEAFEKGTAEQIQELIAVYQGGPVKL